MLTNSCAYEALLKMLYDRTFGGAYSIFQGYHFMKFGIGAVVADIHNCKEEDFALSCADAKTRGLRREITFSYLRTPAETSELSVALCKIRFLPDSRPPACVVNTQTETDAV